MDITQTYTNVNGGNVPTLEILVGMTILMLIPSIVIMMTSFTRIVIILSFLRNAIGVQQTPPNMVLVGIALFLSLFIMSPVIEEINTTAYTPYKENKISQEEALKKAEEPIKTFMLKQTEVSALELFKEIGQEKAVKNPEELPLTVVVPAFMTSELKRGFMAGFLLYLPFLLIDIIVSTTLMSMGMMMLPPATIALPFKLLLFVTVNGWELLFSAIVKSFR